MTAAGFAGEHVRGCSKFVPSGRVWPTFEALASRRTKQPGCHDFHMPPGELSRQELINLVERIMRGDGATEDEDDRLVALYRDSVTHPAALDLIFYWDSYFDEEPTAEQVVDVALAYKPIQLGPGS